MPAGLDANAEITSRISTNSGPVLIRSVWAPVVLFCADSRRDLEQGHMNLRVEIVDYTSAKQL
jgi:hypothetical protein